MRSDVLTKGKNTPRFSRAARIVSHRAVKSAMSPNEQAGWSILPRSDAIVTCVEDPQFMDALCHFDASPSAARMGFLKVLLRKCNIRELSHLDTLIVPELKVDFLQRLPIEVALHILRYLDEPYTLTRAAMVSHGWSRICKDESVWAHMCVVYHFNTQAKLQWMLTNLLPSADETVHDAKAAPLLRRRRSQFFHGQDAMDVDESERMWLCARTVHETISLHDYFRTAFITESNWYRGGRLLTQYESLDPTDLDADPNMHLALTSCAMDANWVVVGSTNKVVYVFSARTGQLVRTLAGHESGVWCLMLIQGEQLPPPDAMGSGIASKDGLMRVYQDTRPCARLALQGAAHGGLLLMDAAHATHASGMDAPLAHTRGWGRSETLLISAGTDRGLRVWNVHTGECVQILRGHTSTIRCIQVLPRRPLAVSGSRDGTLRVWDLERGTLLRALVGHRNSVRCMDTHGNRVASGSYDFTCRVWDVDTGQCLHVLKGHQMQIYAVAFDGKHVVTGSSDSTVRVWNAETGANMAIFQGYTHVVAQLQLHKGFLASGSGDGRVIVFSLETFECLYRLCAHDSSVSTLQMNDDFLVTGGADGLVKLWDARSGRFLRQLCEPCDAVWSVRFMEDKCVILCKRNGKCSVEITSFLPLQHAT
ncbi:hypothetical protein MVES1_003162 [Malassezia vespertilionis]|uniref:uncharacterized protein n=1 Tax=Malassezia vespertilionis TaxID=2020962 RepID=UPI0024B0FE6B|nr:uncharacterized protein MVES1_003162 [Malassezia vespertilionis]WFD07791.1 hypothetical protein MVES1_003162 [Malassezia vespertilionis]